MTATLRFPTRRQFEKWLQSHPPDEVAGVPCKGDRCPIAEYLVSRGAWDVSVDSETWSAWIGPGIAVWDRPMPRWAQDFIHGVDTFNPSPWRQNPITYGDCIEILGRIP